MTLDLDAWADAYVATLYTLAWNDFGLCRQLFHPDKPWGWFLEELARELTRFYHDLIDGRRPKLALMAPPRHGKTFTIRDFILWFAGKHPDLNTVYASYSDELSTSANRYVLRTIASNNAFRKIFPDLGVGAPGWAANNNVIEFVGHGGSFRNTTVGGAINGFGFNLGVIDDPHKGSAEANSKLQRDKTWEWLTDDFFKISEFDLRALDSAVASAAIDGLERCIIRLRSEIKIDRPAAEASPHFRMPTGAWASCARGMAAKRIATEFGFTPPAAN